MSTKTPESDTNPDAANTDTESNAESEADTSDAPSDRDDDIEDGDIEDGEPNSTGNESSADPHDADQTSTDDVAPVDREHDPAADTENGGASESLSAQPARIETPIDKSAAVDVAAVPASVLPALKAPTQAQIYLNDFWARSAIAFGYAAREGDDAEGGLPLLDDFVTQVFAGVRRLTSPGAPNTAGHAAPSPIHQFLSGEVIGDLRARYVDGDTLTYSVTQGPSNGEVLVRSNGTYYFKPDAEFARAGGVDAFTVSIDDGSGSGPTVVTVPINVAATLGITRGYQVDNLIAGETVTFNNLGHDVSDFSGPRLGTQVGLASRFQFDVTEYAFADTTVDVFFETATGKTFKVVAYVPVGVDRPAPKIRCEARGGGACDPAESPSGLYTGQSMKLLTAVPSTIILMINLEINGTYGHTWTDAKTYTQSVNFSAEPGKTQTAYAVQPVYRVTANFTVKVGNTTFVVNNAKFDTPRVDGLSPGGGFEVITTEFPDWRPEAEAREAAVDDDTTVVLVDLEV